MAYKILTDTSANLPTPLLLEQETTALPFVYVVNGVENVCLNTEEFDGASYYGMLRAGQIVKTSMVSEHAFLEAMTPVLEEGQDVLYVGMSSGISGAFSAARKAAERLEKRFPQRRVAVFDTRGASLGEGLLVLEAARLRREGASLDDTLAALENGWRHMRQVFTVDDLMYLQRGGRLSRVVAMVGSVLQIKPVLGASAEGTIVVTDKLRGRRGALRHMAEDFCRHVREPEKQTVGIAHADCAQDAENLKALLLQSYPGLRVMTVGFEPVTGSHVGPGALALFFQSRDDRLKA